jgi:hypothetical protein
MLLFTADNPDYVNMPCFPCKEAMLNFASPWMGSGLSAMQPFDRNVPMQDLSPLPQSPYLQGSLAEPCSPTLCQGLAFSAQWSLTRPYTCQSSFSVYLVIGFPQLTIGFLIQQ